MSDDPIEVQGLWWLPENPERRVPGWFTFSMASGGELRLSGGLRPEAWVEEELPNGTVERSRTVDAHADRETSVYPRIHGRSGRVLYNLEDCFSVQKQTHYPTEYVTEKVAVNRFLRGALFEAGDSAPEFDRCRVELRHLTSWVGRSGLSSERLPFPRVDGQPFLLLRADDLAALSTTIHEGEVLFVQSLAQTGDLVHDIGASQRWSLRVHFESVHPLDDFVEVVSDVQDLVTMATGHTCDIDAFALEHPDLPLTSLDGAPVKDYRSQVDYFARWSNRSETDDWVKPHKMYFRLEDFDGIDGVGRWLNVARDYRTELGRVMATRYSADMYLEDRIMNCCAALESLDAVRRGTGKRRVEFLTRLEKCIAYAGKPFDDLIVESTQAWAIRVRDLRHDLAHHRERMRLNTSAAEHVLSEQLFWLFALCMLRLSDAPESTYSSIMKHGQIGWLIDQARDDVASRST